MGLLELILLGSTIAGIGANIAQSRKAEEYRKKTEKWRDQVYDEEKSEVKERDKDARRDAIGSILGGTVGSVPRETYIRPREPEEPSYEREQMIGGIAEGAGQLATQGIMNQRQNAMSAVDSAGGMGNLTGADAGMFANSIQSPNRRAGTRYYWSPEANKYLTGGGA